jgi:hypothetical protein
MTLAPEAVSERVASRRPAPYVGPVAFDEDDAPFFFGRPEEAASVSAKLRSARLTVLYGPSGVGKSSLLRAGVVPLLREEAHQTQDESPFAVCVFGSWGDEPERGLEEEARAALRELAGGERLPREGAALVETLRAWTGRVGSLLVVLDQFEEYLLRHRDRDSEELTGFGLELARIVTDQSLPVNVLVSIREDAWAELDRFNGKIPVRLVNYVRLDHLDRDSAREAIEAPVFAWNRTLPPGAAPYYVEGAVVQALLANHGEASFADETGGDGIETMFLQLALERLWHATVAEGAQVLTLARLEALGVRRIVKRHVLGALGRLTPREQATAAGCFRFLATRAKTKAAHTAADLAEWTRRPEPEVTAALDELCTGDGGRVLRAVAVGSESTRYELFHGVLTEPVIAWREKHDADRHSVMRQRLARAGTAALVLVTLFAGLTFWAIADRNDASRRYHAQQESNRELQAKILQITAAQRAARRAAAAQAVIVRKLTRENDGVIAETVRLEKARTGLDAKIAKLRVDNGALVFAIKRFNTWNAALAAKITDLDHAYDGLAGELADLRAQRSVLKGAAGTLEAEAAVRAKELQALTTQNQVLSQKAGELGLSPVPPSVVPPTAVPKTSPGKPTTATKFTVAGDVAASDPIRHQVAVLELQLAALSDERAEPAAKVRWLRQENALLGLRRDALAKENARLEATRAALESRSQELQQTRTQAAAEHKTLASEAAARQARNGNRAKQIAALQKGNAALQSKAVKQITALGATQREVARVSAENTSLVASLEAPVQTLSQAAEDPSTDAQLAGLLALEAYRLTPFDPDDPLHPDVYNSLWLSLHRLDEAAAGKLIAPVEKPSGAVGTTRSARLAKALCARIQRGLTPGEWSRFLPAGATYTAKAARPCP